jgi:hypothetical protein
MSTFRRDIDVIVLAGWNMQSYVSPLATASETRSIGLSVPHRKHITSALRAQPVNAIYRFVTMVY